MAGLRRLTWGEFDKAVQALAERAAVVKAKCIYGIPRGGLPLAVAISHRSSLPVVYYPAHDAMIVDDIADSGTTIRRYQIYCGREKLAAWVRRASCGIDVFSVVTEPSDAWLVFPWEDPLKAETDYQKYMERRRGLTAADK